MRRFGRENRKSLIALLTVLSLAASAFWFARTALDPGQSERFTVEPGRKIEFSLLLLTRETYGVSLWIGRPAELDRHQFDRLAGCPNFANVAKPIPGATIPFRWIVKSASDESVVDQSKVASITPPGNGCSFVGDGHMLYLGAISAGPGRYRFEFQFTEEIPELKQFPAEVSIRCGRYPRTQLGKMALASSFVLVPLLLLLSGVLALVLLVRAAIFAWQRLRPRRPDRAA
jgi:hypothetical protein